MVKKYGGHDLYLKGAREWVSKTALENLYGITEHPTIQIRSYSADDSGWGHSLAYSLLLNNSAGTYFCLGLFSSAENTTRVFTLNQLLTPYIWRSTQVPPISPSNTPVTVYNKSNGTSSDAFSCEDPSDGVTKYLVRALIGSAAFTWMSESELESAGYTLHSSFLYNADGDTLAVCTYDDETETVETL